jgi:hypothetical protein
MFVSLIKNLTKTNLLLGASVVLVLFSPVLKNMKMPTFLSMFMSNKYVNMVIPILILMIGRLYYDVAIFLGVVYILLTIFSTKLEIIKSSEGFRNDKINIIENPIEDDEELSISDLEDL